MFPAQVKDIVLQSRHSSTYFFMAVVPDDFGEELALLTQQGYRVLALAHKSIRMQWHKAEKAKRLEA